MIPSQLPVFLAVVRSGSFSGAARQQGVSPAAISKAISQLEKTLEMRLFHRSTHSLTLTDDGQNLLDKVGPLLEQLDEQLTASKEQKQTPKGSLKVNLPEGFGRSQIIPLLPEFCQRYPDIELDLHFSDRSVDLIQEGFDIGIGSMLSEDSQLIARPLCPLKLVAVASPEYLQAHAAPQSIEDLEKHQCIGYRSPTNGRLLSMPFQIDGEMRYIQTGSQLVVNNLAAAREVALQHLGITMLGAWHVADDIKKGDLVRVLPQFQAEAGTIWIYYSSREYLPVRTRLFIEHLVENIEIK